MGSGFENGSITGRGLQYEVSIANEGDLMSASYPATIESNCGTVSSDAGGNVSREGFA